jgi:hypothetical protein
LIADVDDDTGLVPEAYIELLWILSSFLPMSVSMYVARPASWIGCLVSSSFLLIVYSILSSCFSPPLFF